MQTFDSFHDPSVTTALQQGNVGVLPTDTVYGLVARAADRKAVDRLYALKSRERKPGTVICADTAQMTALGLDPQVVAAAAAFWPNPLSVVLPCPAELDYLDMGLGTLAVRIPADDELRRLLKSTGPLLTSSANLPGEPTAENCGEAVRYFGEAVDFYVDMEERRDRPPSTVARIGADGALEILRQGAYSEKSNILGEEL